jgi:hypothetical protein
VQRVHHYTYSLFHILTLIESKNTHNLCPRHIHKKFPLIQFNQIFHHTNLSFI